MTEREIELVSRIAVLETKVESLTQSNESINKKLDELLHLRAKGVGAFWLASALTGTGIIGAFLAFIDWLKS